MRELYPQLQLISDKIIVSATLLAHEGVCVTDNKTIGYDTIALAFMPQVPTTECGGSITNNRGWRDEDDEKPKRTHVQTVALSATPKQSAQPKYNPTKFRRR